MNPRFDENFATYLFIDELKKHRFSSSNSKVPVHTSFRNCEVMRRGWLIFLVNKTVNYESFKFCTICVLFSIFSTTT